jgi:S1-C subfamily serine protease
VVAIDGVPVRGVDDMHRLLTGERIGRRAELAVVRDGAQRTVVVTPRELS